MTNENTDRDALSRLEDLKAVAEKLSIEIQYHNLADAEINIQSGYCKVNGKSLIIMGKTLTPDDQIHILLKVFTGFDLEDVYVASWIRERLEDFNTPKTAS